VYRIVALMGGRERRRPLLQKRHRLSNVNTSRIRAFRASAPSPRHAEQVSAPPAARSRLQRLARQLADEKQFDHLARSLRLIRQSFDCRGR
jgi:hypothetical protein